MKTNGDMDVFKEGKSVLTDGTQYHDLPACGDLFAVPACGDTVAAIACRVLDAAVGCLERSTSGAFLIRL